MHQLFSHFTFYFFFFFCSSFLSFSFALHSLETLIILCRLFLEILLTAQWSGNFSPYMELWIYYCVHMSLPLELTLNQLNPFPPSQHNLVLNSNIILPFSLLSLKRLLSLFLVHIDFVLKSLELYFNFSASISLKILRIILDLSFVTVNIQICQGLMKKSVQH